MENRANMGEKLANQRVARVLLRSKPVPVNTFESRSVFDLPQVERTGPIDAFNSFFLTVPDEGAAIHARFA